MTKQNTQALCLQGTKTRIVPAARFRKGDVAFLPYFGQLVKSKITRIDRKRSTHMISVRYIAMVPGADWENVCCMPGHTTYEVVGKL